MKKAKSPLKLKKEKKLPALEVDEVRSPEPSTLSGSTFAKPPRRVPRGTGAESAGQSGDLQDLPNRESADSESVEELAAEGQYREAEIVDAVEEAGDLNEKEIHTHEVPQDDVPGEYIDND